MVLMFAIENIMDNYKKSAANFAFTFRDLFYRGVVFLLTTTILVWLAVFLYASFYFMYVPAVSHVRPVNFYFRACEDVVGICSFPSANVSLTNKIKTEQLLRRGQEYQILLDLEMPESPPNQRLGMFMVRVDMKDNYGKILQTSQRTAMLHYRSEFLHYIYTWFYCPMLLLGSVQEKQTVTVNLFNAYQENPSHPTTEAFIQIQSRYIEIYSSQLRIHAQFSGLRYIMYRYPVVAAIIGIGTSLSFLTIIAFVSWYRVFMAPSHQVVVKVGFDGSPQQQKSIEERREEMKRKLEIERQRRLSLQETKSYPVLSPPVEEVGHRVRTSSFNINVSETIVQEVDDGAILSPPDDNETTNSTEVRHRHSADLVS